MNRLVVIADLVSSRKLRNRDTVQERLQLALKTINRRSAPHLLSPYTLTLGDEFQGVLGNADSIFHDAFTVLHALHPVRLRFSFGIGAIDTRINRRQAIGMDGPAFHNARNGMTALKKGEEIFALEGLTGASAGLARQSLALLSFTCRKWNGTRLAIFDLLCEEMPVKEMAKRLHVSDKAIYKSINLGGLPLAGALLNEVAVQMNRELMVT